MIELAVLLAQAEEFLALGEDRIFAATLSAQLEPGVFRLGHHGPAAEIGDFQMKRLLFQADPYL